MARRNPRSHQQGVSAFAAFAALCLSAAVGLAQPQQGGLAQISPDAGPPFPWEAGRQVSTYSSANLFNGNLLTGIPITTWATFGPDFGFRLYHNSAAATDGLPVAPGAGFSLGEGWSIAYGGQLILVEENEELVEIIVVEDDGLLKSYTPDNGDWIPPAGVHDTLEYDENNLQWILTRKNQWRRIFDADGKLIHHTDSNRQDLLATHVIYGSGRIDVIEGNNECRKLGFEYDSITGQLRMLTEEGSLFTIERRWWLEYDEDDRIEFITGPYDVEDAGQNGEPPQGAMVISITYDQDGRIATITDREGNMFEYTYDGYGRIHEVIDPYPYDDQVQEFLYTPLTSTYKTQYFDRRQEEWAFIFQTWGGLDSMTNPLADDIAFEYDSDRNRTLFTDEEQNSWVSSHDSQGNRLSLTDPLGHRWEWTYDAYNNVITITPPADDQGNVDEDKQIAYEYLDYYDVEEELIADFTHVTAITQPADGEGNGPAVTVLEYYHTHEGDGCGHHLGELKRVTDENGVPTTFWRNSETGLVTTVVEGRTELDAEDYHPVQFSQQYDGTGQPTSGSSYHGLTSASYDEDRNPENAVCGIAPPDPETTYSDPPDLHIPVADCSVFIEPPRCDCEEVEPMFTYDSMKHLTWSFRQLEVLDKVTNWSTYPEEGSADFESSTREMSFEYDELYRLREQTIDTTEPAWNAGGGPIHVQRTFLFDYLEDGLLEAMTDGDGTVTEHGYDDAGRLTRVDVNSATLVQYTLYPTGRIQYATFANGVQTGYTYDDAGRVDTIIVNDINQTTVQLLALDYDWTPDGLVSDIAVVEGQDSYAVNFEYDLRNQLIREWSTDGPSNRDYDLSYSYDQVGNRLTKTDNFADPDIVTTYEYDVHATDPEGEYGSFNNRLMSYEVEQDTTVLERTYYAYDAGGQVKRIATEYPDDVEDYFYMRVLNYDSSDRLWLIRGYEIDTNCNDVTATYAREFRYDRDRQRYAVIERDPDDMEPTGATWHEYVGDSIYKDLTINPANGAVTVDASYAHGYSLASVLNSGGRTYFHGDMLGTTRLITNYSAVAVQSPAFTAFGEPLPLTAAGGPVSQPNLGTRYAYVSGWGYQNDGTAISSKDIGMLHVGARYYDPSIGRFLQRDPLGVAGSLNFYGYANNCPTSVIDPTGNSSFDVAVGAGIIWGATFFFTEFNISLSEHGAIAATIMAALGILDATVIVPLTTWGLFKHICKDLVEFDGSFWLNAYTGGYLHVLGFSVGAYVGYLEAMMLSMSLGLW